MLLASRRRGSRATPTRNAVAVALSSVASAASASPAVAVDLSVASVASVASVLKQFPYHGSRASHARSGAPIHGALHGLRSLHVLPVQASGKPIPERDPDDRSTGPCVQVSRRRR